ncbi:MAG: alanine racemase [Candidatus Paceibacterota bacterium]
MGSPHLLFRPTWLEINLSNLEHNLKVLKRIVHPRTKIIAVIKADAYGHGAIPIAKKLEQLKIDYLAVATLEEAIELRENNIKSPILIFGFILPKDLPYLFKYNLTPSIFSLETAKKLNQLGEKYRKKINIHIKIDTGMNRLGFPYSQCLDSIKKISSFSRLKIEGIYSHFASSKNKNESFNYLQFNRFQEILKNLEKLNIKIPLKHLANSGAVANYPEFQLDAIRVGEILYGFSDFYYKNTNKRIPIKPLLSLKSKIIFLKDIKKGETVGYERTFLAKKTTKIATIPIGYADGYPRALSNKGYALIKGKKASICGIICMDLLMINVSQIKKVKLFDEVVFIGKSKDKEIKVKEIAHLANTIEDEIVSRLGKRLPRLYID